MNFFEGLDPLAQTYAAITAITVIAIIAVLIHDQIKKHKHRH